MVYRLIFLVKSRTCTIYTQGKKKPIFGKKVYKLYIYFSSPEPKAQVSYCYNAPSVVRVDRKTGWPPWPLIGWEIFDFFSETAERKSTKLDRKQDLNVFYKDCVFRANLKNKMAALASDWLRTFRLLCWNRLTEFKETRQEARYQSPLASLRYRADRINKMAASASDWLSHFLLLLWNRWTEFNKTWQERWSQCPLPSLSFSGRSEK